MAFRTSHNSRGRTLFGVVAVVAFWLAALAGPAGANSGSTALSSPAVSPVTGTPSTLITFSVVWTNHESSSADWVRVTIDGSEHDMAPNTGVAKDGITYVSVLTLGAGAHAVVFSSSGRGKFEGSISGPTVTIVAPAPTPPPPTPRPTATPTPTPRPTTTPPPTPRPTATPQPTPTPTPRPTPTSSPTPRPTPTQTPTARPTPTPAPTPHPTPTPAPTATIVPTPTPVSTSMPGSTLPAAGGPTGGTTGSGGNGGGSGSTLGPGGSAGGSPASAGGSASSGSDQAGSGSAASGQTSGQPGSDQTAMAGVPFAGRVPPGDPLDPGAAEAAAATNLTTAPDVLHAPDAAIAGDGSQATAAAGIPGLTGHDPLGGLSRLTSLATLASTTTTLALAFLVFGRKRRDEAPTDSDANLAAAAASPYAMLGAELAPAFPGVDPGTGGTDVNLPRWRRPSLLAARKSDPIRNGGDHVALTFNMHDAPSPGGERHVIRYQLVRLLDRPDELLGQAIDSLDEGDEVEILEQRGTYRRVLTPDGRQGWIHRMTIGDIVTDAAPSPAGFGMVDEDVLLAYLDARARA